MEIDSDVQGHYGAKDLSDLEDLRRRILKLRWIGMEEDAQRLLRSLRPVDRQRISLSGPRDTD